MKEKVEEVNQTAGKTGAAITGLAVLSFAASMIVRLFDDSIGTFPSCLSSLFIAIGFVIFICSVLAVNNRPENKAVGIAGIAFAGIYAAIIFLVYFAEITTVRMNNTLSEEALSIISYGYPGSLFFNYDLLGYAMMALSTFLSAFAIIPKNKGDRALKLLLRIHGVFFLPCLIVPMFPVFKAGAGILPGTILLELWCAYFLPVCILGFRYFRTNENR